jgi:hypothetical protein
MSKKETSIKKQAEKKAVDEALITEVLSRVAEIGVRKAAEEAGVAWQTVNKWKKDAEKELTTPADIKAAVEKIADVVEMGKAASAAEVPAAEEKSAPGVEEQAAAEEKAAPAVEEKTAPAVEEKKNAVELIIESTMGGQISAEEIIKRVKEKRSDAAKIYVKPEENKAYFTYGDSVGHVELW